VTGIEHISPRIRVEHGDNLVETRSAAFDPTRTYRYVLERRWSDTGPAAVFIMLNPSTADAAADDPTIRRCLASARREKCAALRVVNLFAMRATDPAALHTHPDPVGPDNDSVLTWATGFDGPAIAAWGAHGTLHGRTTAVIRLLQHRALLCLRMTQAGQPRHPLYVAGAAPLLPWTPPDPMPTFPSPNGGN